MVSFKSKFILRESSSRRWKHFLLNKIKIFIHRIYNHPYTTKFYFLDFLTFQSAKESCGFQPPIAKISYRLTIIYKKWSRCDEAFWKENQFQPFIHWQLRIAIRWRWWQPYTKKAGDHNLLFHVSLLYCSANGRSLSEFMILFAKSFHFQKVHSNFTFQQKRKSQNEIWLFLF